MPTKNSRYVLNFSKPADWWGSLWRDALPTGNGVFGAAVYGGAGDETVLINHCQLGWQGNAGVLPDVSDKINDVRKKIEEGDFAKAGRIIPDALINKGYRPTPAVPLPLCDLKIHQEFDKPVKDYLRSVNLNTGEVSVTYKEGATRFERRLFVSRCAPLLVLELEKTGPKNLDVVFSLDMHDRHDVRTPVAISKLPDNANGKYERYFMYFAARSDNAKDFGAVARVSTFGGTVKETVKGIEVKGAEKILVTLQPFVESNRDKEWKSIRAELAANKLTYDKMFKAHASAHAKLFESVALDLGEFSDESMEAELARSGVDGAMRPSLVAKLWAYGRYLLICGASTTAMMRPCGLWCGDYKAEKGFTTAAGNLQMLYAQVLGGDLSEYLLPVFAKYEQAIDELKKNAIRLFNCRGIMIPPVLAPGTGLVGIVSPENVYTTWVAASISNLMFEYYRYTGDLKFLKTRALPFMREAALFYKEFLSVDQEGKGSFLPGFSSEDSPLGVTADDVPPAIAKDCTVDFAAVTELLSNFVEGSALTGLYKEEMAWCAELQRKLPPPRINSDGLLAEYADAKLEDNYDSASANMLYGVYPGNLYHRKETEIGRAALATAKRRAVSGLRRHSGESLMRFAGVFARLGNGDEALELIKTAIDAFAASNGIFAGGSFNGMGIGKQDFWATYGLAANLGLSAAVQEMLIQSDENNLRVLPALPNDWKKGAVTGLKTRFNGDVDVEWDLSKRMASVLRVKSRKAKTVTIQFPDHVTKVKGLKSFDAETYQAKIDLPAGKPVLFNF